MQEKPPLPALKRDISGFGGLLLTLTVLSPSIGVFIVGNDLLHQVGSGAFLCFLAAALLGVAMSAVYAELGSAFPHAGGEYTLAGRILGPQAGFAMLAVTLLGNSIGVAASGLGVADYLAAALPGLPGIGTALAATLAVTLLCLLSVRFNALVTGAFLAIELAALAVVAWLGLAHLQGDAGHVLLHPVLPDAAGAMRPVPMMMMGVSASAGIYAFNGYGGVVYFGEEIRNARHSLAGVVYGALAIAAVAELVPMLGVIGGTHDLARLARSATPLPDFILAHGGPVLARVLSLGVALAIFNAMIAIALCGSRQLFATARDRCWPGWACHALERIHPRFGSPYIATLVFGAITLLLCLVPLNLLVLVNGNGNVAMYACLSLAAIAGRRHGVTAHSQARMRFYPAAPLCVLLALAGVVWADLLDPVAGRIGLLVTLSVLLTGAAYYQLHLRRSPDWAFRPPADDALHS